MCYGTNCGREGAFGTCYHPEDCIMRACELSRNMRIYVTRNENVPRHFFALARFLSAFGEGVVSCQN